MNQTGSIPVWRRFEASPTPKAPLERRKIVIVGAGPVGLTMALALGRRGYDVLVLNKLSFIAAGSKAICFSKRTLDIWDGLGVADAMIKRGVVWNVGKVFWGDRAEPIYQFDMLPVKDQRMPAFINLPQFVCEELLIEALDAITTVDIRWAHELRDVRPHADGVTIKVAAPDGTYTVEADWLIACDGSKSATRSLLGLSFEGQSFEDNFLIADVRCAEQRPSERWFWFDPPFNRGQSALLHKQPDNVWRLDFQLGPNVDKAACVQPEFVEPLVRGLLGPGVAFERVWYSVYSFQCCRMSRFVHDRVVFAGDAAHLVSPFGARGCNGGISDVDNLVWKLDLVLRGAATASLLESYNHEAILGADENILNSTRSTDFISPKSPASRALRDAVLQLAQDHPFARPFVNSGRLSTAASYAGSPLSTPDEDQDWAGIRPGEVALDAPLAGDWLLRYVASAGFTLLSADAALDLEGLHHLRLSGHDEGTRVALRRYDLSDGAAYLLRPDQYVAARWREPTKGKVRAALARAQGGGA